MVAFTAVSQERSIEYLKDGINLIETRVYSEEEDSAILKLFAKEILTKDKNARKQLYEKLDMPVDQTVE